MEAIKFAEWLAENHYKMVNKIGDICYWYSESEQEKEITTSKLYSNFKLLNKNH